MSSGSNAPCYKTSPSLARLCWKQRQFESSFAAEQALRHFPNTRLHFLENSQRKSSALSEILPLPQLLSTDLQGDPGGNVSVFLSERVISSCSLCNSPIVAGSHPHLSSETGQVVEAGGSWLISNEDRESCCKSPQPSLGQQGCSWSGSAAFPLPPPCSILRDKVSQAAQFPSILHQNCTVSLLGKPVPSQKSPSTVTPIHFGSISCRWAYPRGGHPGSRHSLGKPSPVRREQRYSLRTHCRDGASHATGIWNHASAASLGPV